MAAASRQLVFCYDGGPMVLLGVRGLHDRPGRVGSSLGARLQGGGPSDAAAQLRSASVVSAGGVHLRVHGRGDAAASVLLRLRPH
eukprot:15809390-Heterocapsa_arctica.AAC.1